MARLSLDPEPEFRALIDEGRALADAGELDGAERLFKGALLAARDVQPANECYALASLLTVYQRTGRHFETLVLARLLTDRLQAAGETAKAAGCLAVYVVTLEDLGADDAARHALRELGPLLATVPLEENTMAHEQYHLLSALHALDEGDVDRAMADFGKFKVIEPKGESRSWRKDFDCTQIQAQIACETGDYAAGLAYLDEGLAIEHASVDLDLGINRGRADCLTRLGRMEEAHAAVLDLLDRIEGLQDDPFRASTRIRVATWIAAWLDEHGDEPENVRHAYDLAAAAVIERICQLDEAMKELPELGIGEATQSPVLIAVRKAFLEDQGRLMKRVAEFLGGEGGSPAEGVILRGASDGFIRVCAWCERVSQDADAWLPIGHYVPRNAGGIRITHTICPSCASQLE